MKQPIDLTWPGLWVACAHAGAAIERFVEEPPVDLDDRDVRQLALFVGARELERSFVARPPAEAMLDAALKPFASPSGTATITVRAKQLYVAVVDTGAAGFVDTGAAGFVAASGDVFSVWPGEATDIESAFRSFVAHLRPAGQQPHVGREMAASLVRRVCEEGFNHDHCAALGVDDVIDMFASHRTGDELRVGAARFGVGSTLVELPTDDDLEAAAHKGTALELASVGWDQIIASLDIARTLMTGATTESAP